MFEGILANNSGWNHCWKKIEGHVVLDDKDDDYCETEIFLYEMILLQKGCSDVDHSSETCLEKGR